MNEPVPKSLELLDDLKLPPRQFMVMGSGILEALGIRDASDVDLVVNKDLYRTLSRSGWRNEITSNGTERLAHSIFQVYDRWFDETEVKDLDQLLFDAQWIDEVAFNSLRKLMIYKKRRAQEKDLLDVALIDDYLSRQ